VRLSLPLSGTLEPTSTNLVVPSLRLGAHSPARASGAAVLLSGPPLTVAPLSFPEGTDSLRLPLGGVEGGPLRDLSMEDMAVEGMRFPRSIL
jgi:hypothetical protein